MSIRNWAFGLGSALVVTVAGCAAADKTASEPSVSAPTTVAPIASTPSAVAPDTQPLIGWYLQGASGSRLQPCGQSEQWPIGAKADLEARAKAFDLQEDTPVYVKLLARVSDDDATHRVDVVKVEQFGSPTPVRDCGMTGVVTPAPGA